MVINIATAHCSITFQYIPIVAMRNRTGIRQSNSHRCI